MLNKFLPGTVFDNIAVFADSLGSDTPGIVLKLAMIPWESVEDRDAFITHLVDEPPKPHTFKYPFTPKGK